jgi:hypothetical protein
MITSWTSPELQITKSKTAARYPHAPTFWSEVGGCFGVELANAGEPNVTKGDGNCAYRSVGQTHSANAKVLGGSWPQGGNAGLIHPLQASWGSSVKQPMLQQLQLDGSPLQRMLMGGVMANDNFGHEAKVYRDLLSEGGSIYQVAKEFVRNNTTGKFLNLMHPEPEPWQYQHQYCAQAAQL